MSLLSAYSDNPPSLRSEPRSSYEEGLIKILDKEGIPVGLDKELKLESVCKFANNIGELQSVIKNHESDEEQAIEDIAAAFKEMQITNQLILRLEIEDNKLFSKISVIYAKKFDKDLKERFADLAKDRINYLLQDISMQVTSCRASDTRDLMKYVTDLREVAREADYIGSYGKALDLSLEINTYFEAPLVNLTINSLVDGIEMIADKCPAIKTIEGDKVKFATNLMKLRPILADSMVFAIQKLKIDPFTKNVEGKSIFDEFLDVEVDFLDVKQRFKLLDYFLSHANFESQELDQESKGKLVNLVISYGGDKAPEMINKLAKINCKLPRPDFTSDELCPVKSILLSPNNIATGNYDLINTALENSEGFPFNHQEVLGFFKRKSFYAGNDLEILSKISSGQELTLKNEKGEIVFQREDCKDSAIEVETKKLTSNIGKVNRKIEELKQEIQKEEDLRKEEEDSRQVFSRNDLNELEARLRAEFAIKIVAKEEELQRIYDAETLVAKKSHDEEMAILKTEKSALESNNATLKEEVSTKETSFSELKTKNQDLSSKYEDLVKKLKELQGKHDALEGYVASFQSKIQGILNEKFAAEKAQTRLEGELDATQKELKLAQKELEERNVEIAELRPKIETLETENKDLKGKKALIDQENAELRQKVTDPEKEAITAPKTEAAKPESEDRDKIAELERQLAEAKEENGTLRRDFGFAKQDLETSRRREVGLEEKLEQLQYVQGDGYYTEGAAQQQMPHPGGVYPVATHPWQAMEHYPVAAVYPQQLMMGYGGHPYQQYQGSHGSHGTVPYTTVEYHGQVTEVAPGVSSEAMATPPQSTPTAVEENPRTPSPVPGEANGEVVGGSDNKLSKSQ